MRLGLAAAMVGLLLSGACTTDTVTPVQNRNYAVGAVRSASLGSDMVMRESLIRIERKVWVGLLVSPDGWQRATGYGAGSFRQSLVYTGRSGNTISVSYREYQNDMARPAFFQELRYDLSSSMRIVFRNLRITVQAADNEAITFVVDTDEGS